MNKDYEILIEELELYTSLDKCYIERIKQALATLQEQNATLRGNLLNIVNDDTKLMKSNLLLKGKLNAIEERVEKRIKHYQHEQIIAENSYNIQRGVDCSKMIRELKQIFNNE